MKVVGGGLWRKSDGEGSAGQRAARGRGRGAESGRDRREGARTQARSTWPTRPYPHADKRAHIH